MSAGFCRMLVGLWCGDSLKDAVGEIWYGFGWDGADDVSRVALRLPTREATNSQVKLWERHVGQLPFDGRWRMMVIDSFTAGDLYSDA